MPTLTYSQRRGEIEHYFDRTALDAWEKLTSDAPVSGIRATVRAGRDRMRSRLSSWLPEDLTGKRVLDAGCGTGALAVELAARGAEVTAVDLSPSLVEIAAERAADLPLAGSIHFASGDMLDPAHGEFDHVVAMDSVIHYRIEDVLGVISGIAERTGASVLFTFAPRTPLLSVMHAVGKLLPSGDRAPRIVPVARKALERGLGEALPSWRWSGTERIVSGFYTSQAVMLARQPEAGGDAA